MNSEVTLRNSKSFWLGIFIPLIISLFITGVIIHNSELIYMPSYLGFNMALEIFKVPIAISALIFPIVALVATHHRSEQSAEIMRRNTAQNCFSNYYTHREELFKVLSKLENELNIKFHDSNGLYRELFPYNSTSNINIRSTSTASDKSLIEFQLDNCQKHLEYSQSVSFTKILVSRFYDSIYLDCVLAGFKVKDGIPMKWPKEHKFPDTLFSYSSNNPLQQLMILIQVLEKLADFCHIENKRQISYYCPGPHFTSFSDEIFEINPNQESA